MTSDPVDTPSTSTPASPAAPPSDPPAPPGSLGPQWWGVYLLPFVVYMLVGAFEPSPPNTDPLMEGVEHEATFAEHFGITYDDYPKVYTVKIGLTVLTMLVMIPAYLKFPFRVSWLAVGVGVVGVVLWVFICWLHLEPKVLKPIGMGWLVDMGERPSYDPFERLAGYGAWMYGFLAVRFLGLALIVPVIEEFFLRGWLMRWVIHPDWWKIPFGKVNALAVVVGTAVPMLMHPGELLASLVWFSMVTWLMIRTKNIWDCVAAHVVTNLLLGIFIISSAWWSETGWWWLW